MIENNKWNEVDEQDDSHQDEDMWQSADRFSTSEYQSEPGYDVKLQLSESIRKWGMDEDFTPHAIWENVNEGAEAATYQKD